MAYRFEFAPTAIAQAGEIHDRIAELSPEQAAKWYRGLFEKIDTLKSFPLRCPKAEVSGDVGEEYRELLYGKRRHMYRVLFTVHDDLIRIVSIWRASRGSVEL
jgi:plasmid stabilization system protein ParE